MASWGDYYRSDDPMDDDYEGSWKDVAVIVAVFAIFTLWAALWLT